MNGMDGKTLEWRHAADELLEALARDNKYIVADMVQVFLESAGYGLEDYSPLGGVFKRAVKRGIVTRIDRPSRQALWLSRIYGEVPADENVINQPIFLEGFGAIDGKYIVTDLHKGTMQLKRIGGAA